MVHPNPGEMRSSGPSYGTGQSALFDLLINSDVVSIYKIPDLLLTLNELQRLLFGDVIFKIDEVVGILQMIRALYCLHK